MVVVGSLPLLVFCMWMYFSFQSCILAIFPCQKFTTDRDQHSDSTNAYLGRELSVIPSSHSRSSANERDDGISDQTLSDISTSVVEVESGFLKKVVSRSDQRDS